MTCNKKAGNLVKKVQNIMKRKENALILTKKAGIPAFSWKFSCLYMTICGNFFQDPLTRTKTFKGPLFASGPPTSVCEQSLTANDLHGFLLLYSTTDYAQISTYMGF